MYFWFLASRVLICYCCIFIFRFYSRKLTSNFCFSRIWLRCCSAKATSDFLLGYRLMGLYSKLGGLDKISLDFKRYSPWINILLFRGEACFDWILVYDPYLGEIFYKMFDFAVKVSWRDLLLFPKLAMLSFKVSLRVVLNFLCDSC